MSDPTKPREPDDDPFLEFPSEKDLVSGLTRRLRDDDDDGADTAEGSADEASSDTPAAASLFDKTDESAQAPTPDPPPVVRPVSRSELMLEPKATAFPSPPTTPAVDRSALPDQKHLDHLTDTVRARARARSGPASNRIVLGAAALAAVVTLAFVYAWLSPQEPVDTGAATPEEELANATITSRPDGARVVIDGVERGQTPLTVALSLGDHALELQSGDEQATMPLNMEPNTAVSAHVEMVMSAPPAPSPAPPVPTTGWLSIDIPVDLHIQEDGVIIGTTLADRVMLSTGRHLLELTSEELEFRAVVTVIIAPGLTSIATVELPNGSLAISAWPWANVSVDGLEMGATPIGRLSLPIGDHEVVWSHPQFGERRQTVTVTAQTPVQVGVDFTR